MLGIEDIYNIGSNH